MRRIAVYSDQIQHEAYIHALIKSFFPEDKVRVITRPGQKVFEKGCEADVSFRIDRQGDEASFEETDSEDGFFAHSVLKQPGGKMRDEEFKNFIYKSLCDYTQRELPWGSLMGVRPTKLARTMLEERKAKDTAGTYDPKEEILDRYRQHYYVSREKAELAFQVAQRELSLIQSLTPEDGFSLYVGVPFCPTRCLYCSFTSNSISACGKLKQPVLAAMEKEIREVSRMMAKKKPDTVYIGGGTPTALLAEELSHLLEVIGESFDLSDTLEYTVEAGRADSITPEKLRVIKKAGAKRICINPQTMNEETLRLIGRSAMPDQVKSAYEMAREEGFEHINMDLILGLPGENTDMVRRTLSLVKEMAPDSMTVHSLAVKRGSDLHRAMTEKGVNLSWDTGEALREAYLAAQEMGLLPYYLYRQKNMTGNLENVGFAKEGKFGIYNILIMEEVQSLIACGPGGVTKRVHAGKISRCENVRELALYASSVDEMIERKKKLFLV